MPATPHRGDWRRNLRRSIGWTLFLKFIALLALWVLFFSPAHRMDVTSDRVDSQLDIGARPEKSHD